MCMTEQLVFCSHRPHMVLHHPPRVFISCISTLRSSLIPSGSWIKICISLLLQRTDSWYQNLLESLGLRSLNSKSFWELKKGPYFWVQTSRPALPSQRFMLPPEELFGSQHPNLCFTIRPAMVNHHQFEFASTRHGIISGSSMSNWVIPAISSRADLVTAKPLK